MKTLGVLLAIAVLVGGWYYFGYTAKVENKSVEQALADLRQTYDLRDAAVKAAIAEVAKVQLATQSGLIAIRTEADAKTSLLLTAAAEAASAAIDRMNRELGSDKKSSELAEQVRAAAAEIVAAAPEVPPAAPTEAPASAGL